MTENRIFRKARKHMPITLGRDEMKYSKRDPVRN
jgi:hypothetical protein